MKLRFQFLDAKGYLIEQFSATLADAMDRINQFIALHGTGQDGVAGSVHFEPIDGEWERLVAEQETTAKGQTEAAIAHHTMSGE